jgi:hypothetical protein
VDVWCLDMFRLVEFHRIPAAVGPFENIPMGTNPPALTESDLSGVDLGIGTDDCTKLRVVSALAQLFSYLR